MAQKKNAIPLKKFQKAIHIALKIVYNSVVEAMMKRSNGSLLSAERCRMVQGTVSRPVKCTSELAGGIKYLCTAAAVTGMNEGKSDDLPITGGTVQSRLYPYTLWGAVFLMHNCA